MNHHTGTRPGWYDDADVYELAFAFAPDREVKMLTRLLAHAGVVAPARLLEPMIGGGRLVHIFAFFGENGDHRADLYAFGACFHCDRGNGAFVHSFEFHRRLVGFDFGHDVTGTDRITRLHKPFGERALLHGGRKGGHLDRRWHGCLRYVLAGQIVRPHLWRKGAVLARSLRRIRISE